ncbi:DUF2807 domain-containing protein [Mucilaginibacter sp. RS28]|uniref:DUF2807 domain-containing protein n=1 Tax=Mucilaginibacter straminoryzae TaxID=2932774 RepID=A0A9X1X699_9SPHI|nr:DUF2807 domain-containing protein [Mucilaginibacter straminoryzae]MCJ8210910.1 DUF2807 domain-containing protein [Mucilaginibacter straminoryzae]
MKTTIFTIAAMLVLGVATTTTTKAATLKSTSTVLSDVKNINKIEVRGNVELYVSEGADDNVKVYNSYYSESALVQNQKGVLRISSYKNEKLVVWVTAKDLRSIDAYDNAVVNSFGKLSAISLDVELHNTASANLNLDSYAANIQVNDQAKANLSGSVTEAALTYDQSATVNSASFAATKISRTVNRNGLEKRNVDMVAGLE